MIFRAACSGGRGAGLEKQGSIVPGECGLPACSRQGQEEAPAFWRRCLESVLAPKLHSQPKGSFTGEQMRALSEEYWSLSEEAWLYYEQLGRAATRSHQQGCATFPAYSKSAAYARHVPGTAASFSVPKSPAEDNIAAMLHNACKEQRAAAKAESEMLKQHMNIIAEHNTQRLPAILQSRQLLQTPTSSLFCFPHKCQAVECYMDVTALGAELLRGGKTTNQLSKDWRDRHQGIREASFQQLPFARGASANSCRLSRCCTVGMCVCKGEGLARSRMWAGAAKALQEGLQDLQDELRDGPIMVSWWPTHGDEQSHNPIVRYTAIPLHYARPWRPTLAEVEPIESDLEAIAGDVLTFRPLLRNNSFQLKLPLFLMAEFDLALEWHLDVWKLQEAEIPCPTFCGEVYAKKLGRERCFWCGGFAGRHVMVPFHQLVGRRVRRRAPQPQIDLSGEDDAADAYGPDYMDIDNFAEAHAELPADFEGDEEPEELSELEDLAPDNDDIAVENLVLEHMAPGYVDASVDNAELEQVQQNVPPPEPLTRQCQWGRFGQCQQL